MATQLFLIETTASTHLGTNSVKLNGTPSGFFPKALSLSRGASPTASAATQTVAGTTNGVEVIDATAGVPIEWISPALTADVTISGTITLNVWASENSMSANVAINVVIDVIRANTLTTQNSNTIDQIAKSTRTTEVAVTTRAVNNFTVTPTSTVVNRGDRIRVRIFGDDAGTMAAGFTFNASWNGGNAGLDGDTYVTFTETFTFESEGIPGGTQIFFTNVASDVATAALDQVIWTSRGAANTSAVTNTINGWAAPIQVTDSGGAADVDWFTKRLNAFTLEGRVLANLKGFESADPIGSTFRCEIARVDADGTNVVVWASWCISPTGTDAGELSTTLATRSAHVSGDALAISEGQRLRVRVYIDDKASTQMAGPGTVTFNYNAPSPGGNGDSYLIFPTGISLSEFIPAEPTYPIPPVIYSQARQAALRARRF